MSHSPAAQLTHGSGSGWRTMPTTRSPGARPAPSGASWTRPSDSCPRTSRSRPGGVQPYSPWLISRSVPQTPTARAWTSSPPSSGDGSGTSSRRADPACPGTTVMACMSLLPFPDHVLGLVLEAQVAWVGAGLAEVHGGVDQRDMGEGLGEVAQLAAAGRVVLLGQQPDVVAQPQQPLEQLSGILEPADQGVVVGQPEAAGQEGSLPAGEPVHRLPGRAGGIAEHEPVVQQLPLDGLDGALDPRVGRGQEPHQGNEQEAGVQLPRPVVLGEGPAVGVVAVGAE